MKHFKKLTTYLDETSVATNHVEYIGGTDPAPGIGGTTFIITLDKEDFIDTMSEEKKKEITDWREQHWKDEAEKCKNDPYYFYTTYWNVNGQKPYYISREKFEKYFPK